MNRYVRWVALAGWGAVVFTGALWLTFPSDAVAKRVSWEVEEQSGGEWRLQVASVSPWWFGASARNVIVSTRESRRSSDYTPFFAAERMGVRISPWSLLRGASAVMLFADVEGGRVDATLRFPGVRLRTAPVGVELDATALPLPMLLSLAGAGSDGNVITGGLDVHVDLSGPEGWSAADGEVTLKGNGLFVEKISSERLGEKELNTPIDELSFSLDVDDGHGQVGDGILRSALFEAKIGGEVELEDTVSRSQVKLDVELTLGDWEGSAIESYRRTVESLIATARVSDGVYKYTAESALNRFGLSDFEPAGSAPRSTRRPLTPGAAGDPPSGMVPLSTPAGPGTEVPEPPRDLDRPDRPARPDRPVSEPVDPSEDEDDGPSPEDDAGEDPVPEDPPVDDEPPPADY